MCCQIEAECGGRGGGYDFFSTGPILLTLNQPVGSGRSERGSNLRPPEENSRALPTEQLPPSPNNYCENLHFICERYHINVKNAWASNLFMSGLKHSERRFGASFSAAAKLFFFFCVHRCVGAAPTVAPCIQSLVNKI